MIQIWRYHLIVSKARHYSVFLSSFIEPFFGVLVDKHCTLKIAAVTESLRLLILSSTRMLHSICYFLFEHCGGLISLEIVAVSAKNAVIKSPWINLR